MGKSIYIVGSSHAKRIARNFNFLQTFESITVGYRVYDFAKPGAQFSDLKDLPKNQNSKDITIIQCFGNSLFKKGFHYVDSQGKFHLKSFEPENFKVIQQEWDLAKSYIQSIAGRIIILDNPIRYVGCCAKHSTFKQKLYRYQTKINQKLKLFFQELPRVEVIRIGSLLPIRKKASKNNRELEKLLKDNVHYHPAVYEKIVRKLITKL